MKFLLKVKWWELTVIYLLVFFIARYYVFIPLRNTSNAESLEFRNFLIYNYVFNSFVFLFRSLVIALFLYIGAAVIGLKSNFGRNLSVSIWAQLVYLLHYLVFIIAAVNLGKGFDFNEVFKRTKFKIADLLNLSGDGILVQNPVKVTTPNRNKLTRATG
ncbi:MAG: hypothetical protein AB7E36_17800 [Salinivirgaceae bacterium]